jgi:SNF2 family DNA or RNA helicase
VKVYRLITKNTYERYMFETASKKLGLEMVVLGAQTEEGYVEAIEMK